VVGVFTEPRYFIWRAYYKPGWCGENTDQKLNAEISGNEEQEKVYAQFTGKFMAEAHRLGKIGQ